MGLNKSDNRIGLADDVVALIVAVCRDRRYMVSADTSLTNLIKARKRGLEEALARDGAGERLENHCTSAPSNGQGKNRRKHVAQRIDVLSLPYLMPLLEARRPIRKRRRELEKQLSELAKQLPVWTWAADIRGIGPLGAALIVGEAGRGLDQFANPGKLWKRFGLAPGQRRYTDPDLAKAAGYSPGRRAVAYNLSEALMKQNKGKYRNVYTARKAYLKEQHPNWVLLKKKKRFGGEPAGEAKDAQWKYHYEALRYLAKRFLRDFWRAWRGQCVDDTRSVTAALGAKLDSDALQSMDNLKIFASPDPGGSHSLDDIRMANAPALENLERRQG